MPRLGRDAFPTATRPALRLPPALFVLESRAMPASYTTATVLASSANPAATGATVTLTSTTTSTDPGGATSAPPAGGKVEFFAAGKSVLQTFSDAAGRAVYTAVGLATGDTGVRVVFYGGSTGPDDYRLSEANLTQSVRTPVSYSTATTLTSSANPADAGQAVTLTSVTTAAAPGGAAATLPAGGTIEFFVGGVSVAVVAADAAGRATYTAAGLTAGNTGLRARYAGAGGFDTFVASEGALTQTVRPAVSPPAPPVNPLVSPVSPPAVTVPTPPPPPSYLAVGSDAGGTAQLLNPDGSVRLTTTPFAGFAGAVRVATGDVTGDGVPDLIAAAGPGGEPRVVVYSGADGSVAGQFLAFEPTFLGGLFVAAADFDGDGKAEIVLSPDEGGGPRVRVLAGADGSRSLADFYGIDDANFRGGARPGVGDVNGDRVPDLIVAAGFGGGPRVAVFNGAALLAGQTVRLVDDFFAFEPALRNGTYVGLGDLNGDGYADLVCGAGPGGGPRVIALDAYRLLSGQPQSSVVLLDQFLGDPESRSGVRVAVGDRTGGGYGYVVGVPGGGGAATAVNGLTGAPLTGGPALGAGGAVAVTTPQPAGGANGVPGTQSWRPGDDWKQVSTKFTPPAASDYEAPAAVAPGSPYPTPDHRGTYTAQFTGGVKATKLPSGSAIAYSGTIDAAVTIESQTSADNSPSLGLVGKVRFSGSLTAADGTTLPLDVTLPFSGSLPQVIATSGPRNGTGAGQLAGTESGKTLAMSRVTLHHGIKGFPNELFANFSFEAVMGQYVVQKSSATAGSFSTQPAGTSLPPATTDAPRTGTFTATYTSSGYEVDYEGAAFNTGKTRTYSGTITFTVTSIGSLTPNTPSNVGTSSSAAVTATATVTGSPTSSWNGTKTLSRSTYTVFNYNIPGPSESLVLLNLNSEIITASWDGSVWKLNSLVVSEFDRPASNGGRLTGWIDDKQKFSPTSRVG